jgi:hypothetical protein
VPRKPIQKYYYSVEGESEAYYLQWLGELINREPASAYHVAILPKIEKNPVSYVKKLTVAYRTPVTHVCDIESNDLIHVNAFKETLTLLKEAARQGKKVDYLLGYSNFTFELWLILHKMDCNGSFTHRRQYLDPINRAFQECFYELSEYKREADFKRILRKISLEDVRNAISRAKNIMRRNQENGIRMETYKGYSYYTANPALTIGDSIEKILHDCLLL